MPDASTTAASMSAVGTTGGHIAVIGGGISGLSAAWLLARHHRVTVFEADGRIGGHSHTVCVGDTPVDTGFIVYNEETYPNLTALFAHLDVATQPAEMGFAVSLDHGALEYSGANIAGLFAQKRNLASPRFWGMLRDLVRFYRAAPDDLAMMADWPLGVYLDFLGVGRAFREDHLYPMAAAIWSTPMARIAEYPAAAFVRFCANHGLLSLGERPQWRTVIGGSRAYVARLSAPFADHIRSASPVRAVRRLADGAGVEIDAGAGWQRFDAVVIATHADAALAMLADADRDEADVLGAFTYRDNTAVLHSDPGVMPRRRAAWTSWNYLGTRSGGGPEGGGTGPADGPTITYWMNLLQSLPAAPELFVTLNPPPGLDPAKIHCTETYRHPVFDGAAGAAQARLWSLQGRRGTWFCGAYFGAGFHEDGLQAGLAVAEAIGGVRRPWRVAGESARILGAGFPGAATGADVWRVMA